MAVKHRWVSTDGDMANATSWLDGTVPATKATGVLTLTGQPVDNDTVLIDTKTYTFKPAVNDANDGEVTIGGSESETIDNLIAAIVLDTPVAGRYATAMTLHPSVTAAAGAGDTMDATAKLKGTGGNVLSTTVPIGAYGTWADVTLLGATQWGATDEISVDPDATQDFTTNLDWSPTVCSPVLRLQRFNVDRCTIKFGGPGNPIKLRLQDSGGLNYLGTGLAYFDLWQTQNVFVHSVTSQKVLVLNNSSLGLRFLIVEGGEVEVVGGSLIETPTIAHFTTTGPHAKLVIKGLDEDGPHLLVAIKGEIVNERKMLDASWVIVAPEGRLTQKGILAQAWGEGVLNLGGMFSYEPTSDPGAAFFELRAMEGVSRFEHSDHEIAVANSFQGRTAELVRGSMNFDVSTLDIDLADDFPF